MITINLFDYREELRRIAVQRQITYGFVIVLVFIACCFASWFLEQIKINNLNSDIAEVQGQVTQLQGQVSKVKQMQAKEKRLTQIITGIEALRSGKYTPMELSTDINGAVPNQIWLKGVFQRTWDEIKKRKIPVIFIKDPAEDDAPKKRKRRGAKKKKEKKPGTPFVEITGSALTHGQVAKFVENLEQIPYFDVVFLYKSEAGDNQERNFTIFCYSNEKKSSKKA